jgi:hypothetical protein
MGITQALRVIANVLPLHHVPMLLTGNGRVNIQIGNFEKDGYSG